STRVGAQQLKELCFQRQQFIGGRIRCLLEPQKLQDGRQLAAVKLFNTVARLTSAQAEASEQFVDRAGPIRIGESDSRLLFGGRLQPGVVQLAEVVRLFVVGIWVA